MSNRSRNPRLCFHLRELREKQGLTQIALARLTGVSASALCDLEKGRNAIPDDNSLVAICDVLNITPGDLLTLKEKGIENSLSMTK